MLTRCLDTGLRDKRASGPESEEQASDSCGASERRPRSEGARARSERAERPKRELRETLEAE